jgi:integrase
MHLPDALADALLEHLSNAAWTKPGDFVFRRSDGGPLDPNYLRKKVLYPALRAAQIEPGARSHGFHLFRHSAGSIIHSMTGDIKLAQEQLRHTQMSTTSDTYVHVERKVAERASEALAKAISPACALSVPNATGLISE